MILSVSPSTAVRTFSCPYCEDGGLDELDLLEHCNQNHHQDRRSVVSNFLHASYSFDI